MLLSSGLCSSVMGVSYRAVSEGTLNLGYVTATIFLSLTGPVNWSKKKTALC